MHRTPKNTPANSNAIEARLRQQIKQLSYLPASAAVAIKFIELGKDPDAGPADYEKIIASDAALSTKLLALANSSFFGVRHEVKRVLQAINLLGLGNIRPLGISYCLTGLYNHVKIPRDDAKLYWQASLCKGVAAKTYIQAFDDSRADEAFLAGLFQDIAIPMIHSVAAEQLLRILRAEETDTDKQLAAERNAFGVDHVDVGRLLATKLRLPEAYVDAIGFHHDPDSLSQFVQPDVLAGAVRAASLFPHLPEQWHAREVEELRAFLAEHAADELKDHHVFLDAVQKEFDALYAYFGSGEAPTLRLAQLIPDACKEIANSTSRMVQRAQVLGNEAAQTGQLLQTVIAEQEKLVDAIRIDELTGVLNRSGFLAEAIKIVEAAGRWGTPFAVLFFDVDKFKQTNDTYGHPYGDFVLREVCARVQQHIRKSDVFGRFGGDEFVIILNDIQESAVRATADAITRAIREEPFVKGKVAEAKTISLGVLRVPGSRTAYDMMALVEEADAAMYQAKRSGGGQVRFRLFSADAPVEYP